MAALQVGRRELPEAIAYFHHAGMSVRAIATTLGVSPTTVLKVLHMLNPPDENGMIKVSKNTGLDGKARLNRRVDTTARDSQIRELRAAGESLRAIAVQVECSVGTVHRVLRA